MWRSFRAVPTIPFTAIRIASGTTAPALAAASQSYGIRPGDRVATLMWNHYAHLEAYFAIPVIGGILHTLNLRLHPDERLAIPQAICRYTLVLRN